MNICGDHYQWSNLFLDHNWGLVDFLPLLMLWSSLNEEKRITQKKCFFFSGLDSVTSTPSFLKKWRAVLCEKRIKTIWLSFKESMILMVMTIFLIRIADNKENTRITLMMSSCRSGDVCYYRKGFLGCVDRLNVRVGRLLVAVYCAYCKMIYWCYLPVINW